MTSCSDRPSSAASSSAASDPRGALNVTCKEALEEVGQKGSGRLQRES